MKTALIFLFAIVAVAVGANFKRDARDVSLYGGAAQADAAASGDDAAAMTIVEDDSEGTEVVSGGSATRGTVKSRSRIGVVSVKTE